MLVCFVSLMHILWGLLLFANGEPIGTTSTAVFRQFLPHYGTRAIIYIISGILPIVLLQKPGSIKGLLACLPQQLLLILSAISAAVAVWSGHYADGTPRGMIFIAADQGIYIILAFLYAFETLDRYRDHSE